MKKKSLIIFTILLSALSQCYSNDYGKVDVKKVTDRIYLFTTKPYGDVGMSGNSVAIVTEDCVVVYDSTATPETASTILKEIRSITGKPVRYLINSHWHWDHWGGNQVYLAAFPELQIIAHEKTLEQMMTVEPRWNDQGLKIGLPQYLQDFEKTIAKARIDGTEQAKIKEMEELLAADKNFLMQKSSMKKTYPNVTFSGSMMIRPAGREIQILHARAITVGDTYLFLPKDNILITGDILLSPYPYAIGGTYPADWLKTLHNFAELKPTFIIPGHGDVQTTEFIDRNISMFEKLLNLVKQAKTQGLSLDQTKELAGKQSAEIGQLIGISDPQVLNEFKMYFLSVFVARAYRELDQPLGDLPDGLPQ